jgi:hypothetical protein
LAWHMSGIGEDGGVASRKTDGDGHSGRGVKRCSAYHWAVTMMREHPLDDCQRRSHNGGHSHCSCTVCSRRGYRGHDVFSCAFPTHSPSTRCREEHVKNVRQPWFIVIAAPRTVGTQTVSSVFVAGESFLESERSHFCPREGGS